VGLRERHVREEGFAGLGLFADKRNRSAGDLRIDEATLRHVVHPQRAASFALAALAQKLGALGRTYELHVYADDDHGIFRNSVDGDRRVIAWFKRYMR